MDFYVQIGYPEDIFKCEKFVEIQTYKFLRILLFDQNLIIVPTNLINYLLPRKYLNIRIFYLKVVT